MGYTPYADVRIDDGYGSSESEDGVFPREITHTMGTTEIESEPTRVVVISGGQLDAALSLDTVPVGATNATDADLVPEYLLESAPELAGQIDEIASVGQRTDPVLESIAELDPDLILGNQSGLEDLYPELSKIAPTVLTIGAPPQWREDYLLLAASLGKQQEAQGILDDLSAEADLINEEFAAGDERVVSLIRFQTDRIRSMGSQSTAGMVITESGFRIPEIAPEDDLSVDVSTEELSQLDGDLIIYGALGGGASVEDEIGSMWENLDAVTADNAFEVDDTIWFQNAGPLATKMIMSQFRDYLAQVD